METPQRPDFEKKVDVELLYSAACMIADTDTHQKLIYEIYEKATQLETKRNELEGRLLKYQKRVDDQDQFLHEWETGKRNFFQDLTEEDRDEIIDVVFIMINEYNMDIDHRAKAVARLKNRLPIHKDACRELADLMNNILDAVMHKLVPDNDTVYLDTSRLSEKEKNKLERLVNSGEDERVAINNNAITLNPADLHIEGNHILIDPTNLDPRMRETLRQVMDPEKMNDSLIALPVRALVQQGEQVDEQNIKRGSSFPEENPDPNVEEANQEMYGEDSSTTSEENPNDGLPFD